MRPPGTPGPAATPAVRLLPPQAARGICYVILMLFGIYVLLKAYSLSGGDPTGQYYRMDFLVFWGAARLALAGQALEAFDLASLSAAAELGNVEISNLLWLYPPGYLLLLMPLGALPLWAAWMAFVGVSATAFALALRAPAAGVVSGLWLVLAAPALVIACLPIGQTGALWTAGLVAALWALRSGKPMQVGILLALLTLKPQLGPLVALALAAAREWRAVGWACLFTVLFNIFATPVFGIAYWEHLLAAISEAGRRFTGTGIPVERMVSAYAFLRVAGFAHDSAIAAQALVSLGLVGATLWLWSRRHVGFDLKAAFLCAAIPLATPRAFHYDMVLAVAAALFLARAGFGARLWERLWLLLLWLGPAPMILLPWIAVAAAIAPPLLAGTVAICLLRGRSQATAPCV